MPGLHELPPTSSVIQEHIKRAHYVVYNTINLLRDNPTMEPRECGWVKQYGLLLPDKKTKFSYLEDTESLQLCWEVLYSEMLMQSC